MTITHYIPGTEAECLELSAVLFALGKPQALDPADTDITKYMFAVVPLKTNPRGATHALAIDRDNRRRCKAAIQDNPRLLAVLTQYYTAEEKQLMRDRIRDSRDISIQHLLPAAIKDNMFTAAQAAPYLA